MFRTLACLTLGAVTLTTGATLAVNPAQAAPATGGERVQVALALTGSVLPALAFARTNGLHVDLVTRRSVLLSGPAAQTAEAFGARLHPATARGDRGGAARYLAADSAPTVPAELRGAVGAVVGLDNRPLFQHHAGYTGSDLSAAYTASGLTGAGTGITVATVQFSGWNPSDASTYASGSGISLAPGQITTVQLPDSSTTPVSGGDQEAALDVEGILATAPRAAQRVYIAPNTSAGAYAVYGQIADDVAAGRVQVVSTSWGSCEAYNASSTLQTLAGPINRIVSAGGTIFAATGDSGAYDCATSASPDGQLSVDFPASLPSVVAVGGTRLTTGLLGAYAESAWGVAPTTTAGSTYPGSGSGGGTSAVFGRPAYQSAVSASGTGRSVPDVSALADPAYGFRGYAQSAGGWVKFGGTSFGAPMWAGQLAAALATAGRSSGIGDIHRALYAAPSSAFRDVTSGANGYYSASAGYDQVTGLGSPQWSALYPALDFTTATTTTTTTTISPAPTVSPTPTASPTPGAGTPITAGGTVSSPAGAPVVATVTSPVAGSVSFTTLTAPAAPARTAALAQGLRITGPAAPLTLTFTLQPSLLPAGALPSDVRVVRDGAAVAACGTGGGQCTRSSSSTVDALHYTVTGASAGDWSFAVDRVVRLAGADRVATAVTVSQAAFAAGSAPAAVLARADGYADALAGAPLAATKNGPLLLTGSAALAVADASELTRVVAPGGTIYLLGGAGALSPAVADQVKALGFTVVRLAGADRFATATAIAAAVRPTGPVLLTTGLSFPDALAAGAAAAHAGGVVLLTAGDRPAAATAAYLAAHPGATLFAVGGPAARAYPQATALAGADRYATAVTVARRFFPGAAAAGLASGVSFPDALAAGPVLGARGVPLLLTGSAALSSAASGYLAAAKPVTVHLFGGAAVLGAGLPDIVFSLLG